MPKESEIINARYVGQPRQAGQLLVLARDVLRKAQDDAAVGLRAARSMAAKRVRSARQRAKRAGRLAGQRDASQQLQQRLLELQTQYNKIIRTANEDCLALACSIAEEVLMARVEQESTGLAARINAALTKLVETRSAKIYVHPLDAAIVRQAFEGFTVAGDSAVSRGDARLETVAGTLELDWREHLTTLKHQLEQSLQYKLGATIQEVPHANAA